MQHDLSQFFVDNLFLRFSEVSASLVQRSCLDHETQRGRSNRVGSNLDFSAKFAGSKMMIVAFVPKKAARICVRHEFAFACIERISSLGMSPQQRSGTDHRR